LITAPRSFFVPYLYWQAVNKPIFSLKTLLSTDNCAIVGGGNRPFSVSWGHKTGKETMSR